MSGRRATYAPGKMAKSPTKIDVNPSRKSTCASDPTLPSASSRWQSGNAVRCPECNACKEGSKPPCGSEPRSTPVCRRWLIRTDGRPYPPGIKPGWRHFTAACALWQSFGGQPRGVAAFQPLPCERCKPGAGWLKRSGWAVARTCADFSRAFHRRVALHATVEGV